MLIAKRTLYEGDDGDYVIRFKKDWDWFLCGIELWDTFPLSRPWPNTIRIELHDTPARDRVEITNSAREKEVYCDGVEYRLFSAGYDWLLPHLEKHGTVYAEVWY